MSEGFECLYFDNIECYRASCTGCSWYTEYLSKMKPTVQSIRVEQMCMFEDMKDGNRNRKKGNKS